ncbi:uncharacterized [Tachysurus ichikawai]
MFKLLHGIDLPDLRHNSCHSAARSHRLSAASDESADMDSTEVPLASKKPHGALRAAGSSKRDAEVMGSLWARRARLMG